jgi:hypothetical protein
MSRTQLFFVPKGAHVRCALLLTLTETYVLLGGADVSTDRKTTVTQMTGN